MQEDLVDRLKVEHVVDTTGCGDSFAAGMGFGYLVHQGLRPGGPLRQRDGCPALLRHRAGGLSATGGDQQAAGRGVREGVQCLIAERPAAGLRDELGAAEWQVTESGFDPEQANIFETLFTVGNGRLGTRGTLEEGHVGEVSGTFLSGVYDGYQVPVIDLVNAPDWLSLAVIVNGVRLDVQSCTVVEHERALDFRHGVLWRRTVFADSEGRRTRLESLRFASFADRRLCALRVEVTPLDHDAEVTVRERVGRAAAQPGAAAGLPRGDQFAPEVRWDKWAVAKHLVEVSKSEHAGRHLPRDAHHRDRDHPRLRRGAAVLPAAGSPGRCSAATSRSRSSQDFTVGSGQTLGWTSWSASPPRATRSTTSGPPAWRRSEPMPPAGFDASLQRSREVWEHDVGRLRVRDRRRPEATRAVRFGHLPAADRRER